MFYDFKCDECGQIREIMCSSSEIVGRAETCACGAAMFRVFTPVACTGDLPGRGNIDYYDTALGAHITSGRQRKALMEQRGLAEYSPSKADATIEREAKYIAKHSDKNEIRRNVNKMAHDVTVSDRRKRQAEAVSKSVDQALRGVSV